MGSNELERGHEHLRSVNLHREALLFVLWCGPFHSGRASHNALRCPDASFVADETGPVPLVRQIQIIDVFRVIDGRENA